MSLRINRWKMLLTAGLVWTAISVSTWGADGQRLATVGTAAKGEFKAPTAADLTKAKEPVLAAADRLQKQFDDAGPSAEGWKAFLKWDKVQATLQDPAGPDKALLGRTYNRLASGYDGLDRGYFVDLR
jgi:hypothetical protein